MSLHGTVSTQSADGQVYSKDSDMWDQHLNVWLIDALTQKHDISNAPCFSILCVHVFRQLSIMND